MRRCLCFSATSTQRVRELPGYASQIADLGGNAKHIAFAEFIEANLNGAAMPDYKALDLMQIAHLVRHVWVIDGREGFENGLKILLSGTDVDQHFGRVLMGGYLTEDYAEHYSREVHAAYRNLFVDKRPLYTERSDYYPGVDPEVERRIKVTLFPCSKDDDVVDFAIGLTTFENTEERVLGTPVIARLSAPSP